MFLHRSFHHRDERRVIATLCVTLGVLLWLLGSPGKADAFCRNPAQARNLRIFTYNVHGLPARPGDLDGNEDVYQDTDTHRMNAIADEILVDDPDIVVLNEVWQEDEGGKQTFINKLAGRYPFSIRYVRAVVPSAMPFLGGNIGLNDSGMMLFSKDPFVEFLQDVPSDAAYVGFESCNGPTCGEWGPGHGPREVAIRSFGGEVTGECAGTDCAGQKAVMMVRLQGACPYSVAFTHTDADWAVDGTDPLPDQVTRRIQLALVRDLILNSMTTMQLDQEPIFFAGDINVDGNFAPLPHQQMLFADGAQPPSTEYAVQFDPADPHNGPNSVAAFYACKQPANNNVCRFLLGGRLFTDAYGFETSPTDFGQTNHASARAFDFNFVEDSGWRFDMIFHSNPVSPESGLPFMCMQHITRDFELTNPKRSDHMAVRADFNGMFPRCNAREKFNATTNASGPANGAEPVVFDPPGAPPAQVDGNVTFEDSNTRLRFPGSNQWYIVKDRGTFAVAIEQNGVTSTKIGAAVYHHKDLSRPKLSFHKETSTWIPEGKGTPVTAMKYQFDDPPYFIRVYGMQDALIPDTEPPTANFQVADRAFPPASPTGVSYKAHFHMSQCASLDDACSLTAGAPFLLEWRAAQPRNPEDMAYFTFYTDAVSNAVQPHIELAFEPLIVPPDSVFTTDKVRFFKPTSYNKAIGDCDAGTQPPCNETMQGVVQAWTSWADTPPLNALLDKRAIVSNGGLPPETPGKPAKFILKVGRVDPSPDPLPGFIERIRYETSLTYLLTDQGDEAMTCHTQQSIMYDDQIGMNVTFDSGVPRTDCSHTTCPNLSVITNGPMSYVGQFDDEGTDQLTGTKFSGRYTSFVLPSLYEDVLNDSDHEYLVFGKNENSKVDDPIFVGAFPELADATIAPLSASEGGDAVTTAPEVFTWCGDQGGSNVPASQSEAYPLWNCRNAELWYTMGYHRTHDDVRK